MRKRVVWIFFFFFFYLSEFSSMNRRTTGEGGGDFFWLLTSTSTHFTDTLDISRVMTAESSPLDIVMTTGSSPLHIASSRTRTVKPSVSEPKSVNTKLRALGSFYSLWTGFLPFHLSSLHNVWIWVFITRGVKIFFFKKKLSWGQ